MKFTKVFKKFDFLGKALNYIIHNSDSNYAPYHNLNHNVTITVMAFTLGKMEKISETEMKELLIAAIFHDFNHSAGKTKDGANIKKAKLGVEDFLEKEKISVDLKKVNEILEATEYPYVIKESDLTLQQQIIRDADFLQLSEPNRLQANILGMASETNNDVKKWLTIQKGFVSNCKFNTKSAKELKDIFWDEMVEELEYLIKIVK